MNRREARMARAAAHRANDILVLVNRGETSPEEALSALARFWRVISGTRIASEVDGGSVIGSGAVEKAYTQLDGAILPLIRLVLNRRNN